jgi:flagellar M-ring protein FliF
METILQFVRGIGEFWGKLTLSAKVIIGVSFFVVFLGLMLIVYIEAQPQYVTLSTGLSPQEVSKITDILSRQGVRYQLGDNNTSVSVPVNQRSNAQILLAQNDLLWETCPRVGNYFRLPN